MTPKQAEQEIVDHEQKKEIAEKVKELQKVVTDLTRATEMWLQKMI
jgi:hypothetical protein